MVVTLMCGLALLASPSQAQPSQGADLLRLAASRSGSGMPAGWRVRPVRGFRAPTIQLVDSAGQRFVRIAGTKQAAWFVNELATPLRPNEGRLHWTWRTPVTPAGSSAASPETDDAALRVFVVFERHARFTRTPRALFYTLGDGDAVAVQGPRGPMVAINASRPAGSRSWVDVAADPSRDYQRIWHAEAPRIIAVGVMQDTDQTMQTAVGDLSRLEWRVLDASTR
jgi:hypothetical protein